MIIFVGDGMDITTITAARILKGQLKGNTGEEEKTAWDEFPHVALSKVSKRFVTSRLLTYMYMDGVDTISYEHWRR